MVRITENGFRLPNWADSTSIAGFLTSGVAVLFGLLIAIRPSLISTQDESMVQALIPSLSVAIAAGVQVINMIRQFAVNKVVAASQVRVFTVSKDTVREINSLAALQSAQLGTHSWETAMGANA